MRSPLPRLACMSDTTLETLDLWIARTREAAQEHAKGSPERAMYEQRLKKYYQLGKRIIDDILRQA